MVKAAATLEIQLIADVARLQKDMREMQKAVDAATGGVSTSFNNAGAAATKMARDAQAAAAGVTRMGNSGKLAGHHMANLGFQVQDVIVSLQAGQNPLTVFIQQGGQIGQIAAQAGVGIGGIARALLGMAGAAAVAVVTSPLLLGIAAAAGTAYGAFKLFQSEVKKTGEIDNFAKSLGLTKKEMKELEGVGLTAGDVFTGLWRTIDQGLGLSGVFSSIKSWAVDAFKTALDFGLNAVAGLYAGWAGSFNAIRIIWSRFPAIMGDAAAQAANAAIGAVEWLLNKSIDGLNAYARLVNKILEALGVSTRLGQFEHQNLEKMALNSSGAIAASAKEIRDGYVGAFNDAKSAVRGFGAEWAKNSIAASKDRLRRQADKLIDDRADKKPKKDAAGESLAREIAATEALIGGLYKLADAYQVSDVEAFKAEVRAKATADAIKKQADVDTYVAQQMRLAVAQRAVEGAKAIAGLAAQTSAQKAVNDAVAAGTLNAEQASNVLRDEAQLRPLIVAEAVAEGIEKAKLTTIIERLRKEHAAANAETARAQALSAIANAKNDIERMQLELSLIGKTNAERALALAQLEAEQKLRGQGVSPEDAAALTALTIARATAQAALTAASDNYNKSLAYQAELLDLIDEKTENLADSLSSAFGNVGNSIGTAITALSRYAAVQADLDRDHQAAMDAGLSTEKEKRLYAIASANAQMRGINQMVGGLKGLFKEHSAGYKAMAAAEKALAVVQLIQTARSVAAGAAKMFAQLGPFAFPVVAAMLGVMASLGFGGGGGGGSASIPSAQDLQDAQGTGSVLGDATAKSESIARSLEIMTKNSNRDLEYSNAMVKSLRAIENGIGALAGLVAKQLGVPGGAFDQTALGLGSKSSSPFSGTAGMALIGGALFGPLGAIAGAVLKNIPIIGDILGAIGKFIFSTKTTVTLLDQGIKFAGATIEDILNNGIDGLTYQDIKVKKKKKLFGIGVGGSTKVKTVTQELDSALEDQVGLLIGNLRDSVVFAAQVIGLDVADALDTFKVEIGKISLMDLKGDEVTKALESVFSKVADDMAGFAVTGLSDFQKVGEGVFETLMRLAKDYMTIDASLKSIGMTFGAVGAASVEARENLIDLFGSLDAFTEQTQFFRENFLSDAEQIAPIATALRAELARLGLAGVQTRDQFKAAVLGLDLTTAAGRDMYASLLAVAPAFDKVTEYVEEANRAVSDAFKSTVSEFEGYAKSLIKYRDELRQGTLASGNPYGAARSAFLSTAALAAQGNAAGLSGLEGAGKALLSASRDNASSFNAYLRDVAMVANAVDAGIFAATETADYAQLQLDALNNSVGILASIDAGIVNVQTLLGGTSAPATVSTVTAAAPTTSSGTDPVTAELRTMRAEAAATNKQIAENTAAILSLHRRWDGDGLRVKTDADTPLDVTLANTADAPVYVDQI